MTAAISSLLRSTLVSVVAYRFDKRPDELARTERHEGYSISYVRAGSFGYCSRGESSDLVAGSILVGYPGDEYLCTHSHVRGDECLSFQLAPAAVDAVGGDPALWRSRGLPPVPELVVLGELAQAAAEGRSNVGLDEVALLLAARYVDVVKERKRRPFAATARDRGRAVHAALRIDAHAQEPLDLEQ